MRNASFSVRRSSSFSRVGFDAVRRVVGQRLERGLVSHPDTLDEEERGDRSLGLVPGQRAGRARGAQPLGGGGLRQAARERHDARRVDERAHAVELEVDRLRRVGRTFGREVRATCRAAVASAARSRPSGAGSWGARAWRRETSPAARRRAGRRRAARGNRSRSTRRAAPSDRSCAASRPASPSTRRPTGTARDSRPSRCPCTAGSRRRRAPR